jgi:hypothetical protein
MIDEYDEENERHGSDLAAALAPATRAVVTDVLEAEIIASESVTLA